MKHSRILSIGTHIISLPIDREYKIDELFPYELANSWVEILDPQGVFVSKEKVKFLNNEFVVSDMYKTLQPFQTLRLTLKRAIEIDWDINFSSNVQLIKEHQPLEEQYSDTQALQLVQFCS